LKAIMKSTNAKISPLTLELSTYIASALRKPLPAHIVDRAKVHMVDTYASMISGSRLLPGRRAIAYVKALGGKPQAGVIGTRIVTSVTNAALANGMLAHADETDDTHPPSRTHPGSGVVPAALAIGERDRLPGTAVLRAVVLGYDICARIMLAIGELHFRSTGHHPSTFGRLFGAASAAGALLKLDAREIRFLLSYAAQQAAGLSTVYRDTEHIEKAFLSGMPTQCGVAAAVMVEHGFTGVEDVFAGDRNFFFTFAPQADQARLTRGLGTDYEILRCGIKRWSAGGPIQAPLHVLHDLIKRHGFSGKDVQKLVVRMPDKDLMSVNNRDMPNICVQHLLAVMLKEGTTTFKATHDSARMRDPAVLALRAKVEAVGDPGLTNAERGWRCIMDVTLKDGRHFKHETMMAKGSAGAPLSRDEEQEKALDLMAPVLGKRRAQALLTALWEFDRVKDVRSLRSLASAA
jgi:2-methylcitrate dehydratase PrpD